MPAESAPRVIFCADPFNSREPDPAYAAEASAVHALGLDYGLISYEAPAISPRACWSP